MLVVEVDEVVDVVEVVVVDVVVVVVVLTAIQVSFFSFNFPSLHLTSVIDASLKYFALNYTGYRHALLCNLFYELPQFKSWVTNWCPLHSFD